MAGFVPAVAKTTGEDDHLAQDMILGLVGAVVVVHALEQPIVGGVDQIELAALGVVPDLEFHFLAPFWISRAMSSTSSCIVISALTRSAHACWASLVMVLCSAQSEPWIRCWKLRPWVTSLALVKAAIAACRASVTPRNCSIRSSAELPLRFGTGVISGFMALSLVGSGKGRRAPQPGANQSMRLIV